MKLPAETISVTSAPTVEPVNAAEAKLHLRVDHDTENTLIERLISVARRYCEQVSGRAFITQTLEGGIPKWPVDGVIRLPYLPLSSVTSIKYTDSDGTEHTLANTVYGVDTKLGLIYLEEDQQWPSVTLRRYDPITITWVSGYGTAAADIPDIYKQATLLMVGHLYENREAVIAQQGVTMGTLPLAVEALLMLDRGYY